MRIRLVAALASRPDNVLASTGRRRADQTRPHHRRQHRRIRPMGRAVFSNGSFTCSGTIISANYVLTARHCISGSMSVRVGSVEPRLRRRHPYGGRHRRPGTTSP